MLFRSVHAEAAPLLSLSEAHARVHAFETALGKRLGNARIVTHIEPEHAAAEAPTARGSNEDERRRISQVVETVRRRFPADTPQHDKRVFQLGESPHISFRWCLPGKMSVAEAHAVASALERELRGALPELDRVLIHTDPEETPDPV